MRLRLIIALSAIAWVVAEAAAHPLNWTRLTLSGPDAEGLLEARLEIDLARYLGGYEAYLAASSSSDGSATLINAAERAWCHVSIRQGGVIVEWTLEELIPPPPDEGEFLSPLPAPMAFVRWSGRASAGPTPVVMVVSDTPMELPLVLRFLDTPDALPVILSAGQASSRFSAPDSDPVEPVATFGQESLFATTTARPVLIEYVRQGFLHIMPHGIDHILFILGLFFAGGTWRRLFLQVSAFTLAHTFTLGLVTLDLLPAPPRLVEPLIALSIVWLAWENLRGGNKRSCRLALVFIFGLLHGMGFATVLGELGLPRERLAIGLFAFNLGVELGQLAVLAGAAAVLAWWRHSPQFRPWAVLPASLAIGATAAWWTLERLFFA